MGTHIPHIFSENPNDLQGRAGEDAEYVADYRKAQSDLAANPMLAEEIVGKGLKSMVTHAMYTVGLVSARTAAAIDHVKATTK